MGSRIGELIKTLSNTTSTKNQAENFNIAETIQSVFKQEQTKLETKKIQYSIKSYNDIDFILHFEKTQFKQIISNLIHNSIDSIDILKRKIKGEISVYVREYPDKYIIHFSDNGKGIEPKDEQRIFTPFYTTKNTGEGLGLYIISKLLEIRGGKIYLDNKYTQGAKFIINLIK